MNDKKRYGEELPPDIKKMLEDKNNSKKIEINSKDYNGLEDYKKVLESEKDLEYRVNREYDEKFLHIDGYVKVIIDNLDNTTEVYSTLITESDDLAQEQKSLNDILNLFGLDFNKIDKYSIIYIWIDSYMQGEIWKCSKVDGEKEFSFYAETRGFV